MRRKVESIYLEGVGGAYLGHEANLLGQIHQLDEISLGPLWSGDTLSIPHLSPPPPSHMARGRWTAVLGERPPWGWAPGVGRCSTRDFNPTGQLFQSAFSESPHRKNFKQIQVLCFSAQGPINQLPERSGRERKKRQQRSPTPWLSLILLGQGEPECEAAGRSAPCFKLTPRAERLHFFFFRVVFFLLHFADGLQNGQCSGPNKWEESCFTAFNCTFVPTDMTFEDGEDNDINKDRRRH